VSLFKTLLEVSRWIQDIASEESLSWSIVLLAYFFQPS